MKHSGAFILLCVLNVWTIGQSCKDGQTEINKRCCDKCPPGTYMTAFCSDTHQTKCSPCKEGHYSDKLNVFNMCEKCQSCEQGYSEKCTTTTKGTCSCRSGFLCSNNICSRCVKNTCEIWERSKKIEKPGSTLSDYSYECEPICLEDQFYDVKTNTCEPQKKCSDSGQAEWIPGNKTHNPICYDPAKQISHQDLINVSLCIGFVLFSLSLVIYACHICAKNLRKHKANNVPIPVVSVKSSEFHLSKEESGIKLIIQDDSEDC